MVRSIKVLNALHLVATTALTHQNAVWVKTAMHYLLVVHFFQNLPKLHNRVSCKIKVARIARLLLKHDTTKFDLAFRQEKETDTFLILNDIHQLHESRCVLQSSQ